MKNILATIALTTFFSLTTAQEVKIKKDNIMIGDLLAAGFVKEKDAFVISDASGRSYKASIKSVTPKGRKTSQKWIELTNKEGKIQELPLDLKSININMQKRLVENLVAQGYITTAGIEPSKYANSGTPVSNELDAILDGYEEAYAKEDKLAAENKLLIGKNQNGFYPITKDFVLVGYMTGKSIPDPADHNKQVSQYFVYDTSKQPIAELIFGSYDTGNELKPKYIKTYSDNKEYPIITKCEFLTLDQEPMAKRMVKLLFANGYLK